MGGPVALTVVARCPPITAVLPEVRLEAAAVAANQRQKELMPEMSVALALAGPCASSGA